TTLLPPRVQRHPWLRYKVEGYTKGIVHNFKHRLDTSFGRQDRSCLPAMHKGGSTRSIPDKGDLRNYWIEISSDTDFLGAAPSYGYIKDLVRRLCHMMISYSISGRGQAPKKYLFKNAEGRKSGARMSRGHFIGSLAAHFGLVAAAGASKVVEGDPVVDEGVLVVPTPVQAPQPPFAAAPARTIAQRLSIFEEESEVRYMSYTDIHQRCVQHRTGDDSTSAPKQLDP
nr:hypothetical protein [Tanacetum cinerariifolium]